MTTPIRCENKSDQELVELALQDQEWYLCLLRRYQDKLARYIRRISGAGEQDIEDLLQEVFIKVYRNLNGFDKDLKFSSWIYRICHNEVISHYRKSKARPQIINGEEGEKILEMIQDRDKLDDNLDNKISQEKIAQVLSQMDVKYREVLVLKYLEDKDYQEISDILKKPSGTVATLLHRAKKQFAEISSKQGTKF